MCQIALFKSSEKVKKTVKNLTQYFWKEQFDTFGNRCDILRALQFL